MIDYFTAEELSDLQYLIISAGIRRGDDRHILDARGILANVVKVNDLYPTTELIADYGAYGDIQLFRKSYFHELHQTENIIYRSIIGPILHYHHNMVIICKEDEDYFIDVLVQYLNKEFAMKTIDLNELFINGETSIFYIDKKQVHDHCVQLTRTAAKEQYMSLSSTKDGREYLIDKMDKDTKIKKLKELGVTVGKIGNKEATQLLIETWSGEID